MRPPSRVALELAAACEEIGFFTIVGHGVSEELIARTPSMALAFFAQLAEAKRAPSCARRRRSVAAIARSAIAASRIR